MNGFGSDPLVRLFWEPDMGGGAGGAGESGGGSQGRPESGSVSQTDQGGDDGGGGPAIDPGKYAEYEKFHKTHSPHADRYQRLGTLEGSNPEMKAILGHLAQFGQFPQGYGRIPPPPRPPPGPPYKFFQEGEDPDEFWTSMAKQPLSYLDRAIGSPNFNQAMMKYAANQNFQRPIIQAVLRELDNLPAIRHLLSQHGEAEYEQTHGEALKELEKFNPKAAEFVKSNRADPAAMMKFLQSVGLSAAKAEEIVDEETGGEERFSRAAANDRSAEERLRSKPTAGAKPGGGRSKYDQALYFGRGAKN